MKDITEESGIMKMELRLKIQKRLMCFHMTYFACKITKYFKRTPKLITLCIYPVIFTGMHM